MTEFEQALRDPENQPSQYGTVPVEMFNKVRDALEEAVANLQNAQSDVSYAFDPDYTPYEERLLPRMRAVLKETELPR